MKELHEAITASCPLGHNVVKHLSACGIQSWSDCTKVNLSEFVDYLLNDSGCAQSSAHTYVAILKSVLNQYKEAGVIPCSDIKAALRCKNERSQKIYLTQEELERLERVDTFSENERFVKLTFLISARTGMRISDTLRVTPQNISCGKLSYVSQKTSVEVSGMPISVKAQQWIAEANGIGHHPSTSNHEAILRRLCERAKILDEVRLFKHGKTETKEKWEWVTTHTARVSFVTNLLEMGVPLITVSRLAGHTNTTQTEAYNASKKVMINDAAMAFFNN